MTVPSLLPPPLKHPISRWRDVLACASELLFHHAHKQVMLVVPERKRARETHVKLGLQSEVGGTLRVALHLRHKLLELLRGRHYDSDEGEGK